MVSLFYYEHFAVCGLVYRRGTRMAKRKKTISSEEKRTDDFTSDLISSLNKELGERVAYNLAYDESPTHVNRWISLSLIHI